jgi:hypothetical protein
MAWGSAIPVRPYHWGFDMTKQALTVFIVVGIVLASFLAWKFLYGKVAG